MLTDIRGGIRRSTVHTCTEDRHRNNWTCREVAAVRSYHWHPEKLSSGWSCCYYTMSETI